MGLPQKFVSNVDWNSSGVKSGLAIGTQLNTAPKDVNEIHEQTCLRRI